MRQNESSVCVCHPRRFSVVGFVEVVLADAADGADPVGGEVFEGDAAVLGGIVDVAAHPAHVFLLAHHQPPFSRAANAVGLAVAALRADAVLAAESVEPVGVLDVKGADGPHGRAAAVFLFPL